MVGDEAHNCHLPAGTEDGLPGKTQFREPYEGSQFTVVSEELKRAISLAEIKVKIAALGEPK